MTKSWTGTIRMHFARWTLFIGCTPLILGVHEQHAFALPGQDFTPSSHQIGQIDPVNTTSEMNAISIQPDKNTIRLSFPAANGESLTFDIEVSSKEKSNYDEPANFHFPQFPPEVFLGSNKGDSGNIPRQNPSYSIFYLPKAQNILSEPSGPIPSLDVGSNASRFKQILINHPGATQITFIVVRASISAAAAFAGLGGAAMLVPAMPALGSYVGAFVDSNPAATQFGPESIVSGALIAGILSGITMAKNKKINDWLGRSDLWGQMVKNVFFQAAFVGAIRIAAQSAHQVAHFASTGMFDPIAVATLIHEMAIVVSSVGANLLTQNFWSLWISERQKHGELKIEKKYSSLKEANQNHDRLREAKNNDLASNQLDIDSLSLVNSAILNTASLMVGAGLGGEPLQALTYGIGALGAGLWYRLSKINRTYSGQNLTTCTSIFGNVAY